MPTDGIRQSRVAGAATWSPGINLSVFPIWLLTWLLSPCRSRACIACKSAGLGKLVYSSRSWPDACKFYRPGLALSDPGKLQNSTDNLTSRGIVGAVIRFVEFFNMDFSSELPYGVWTMIYTTMEACACFVCSCLPGTRPLIRWVYRASGLRDIIQSHYRRKKPSPTHIYDLPLFSNPQGNSSATRTTCRKAVQYNSEYHDATVLIRPQKALHLDITSRSGC